MMVFERLSPEVEKEVEAVCKIVFHSDPIRNTMKPNSEVCSTKWCEWPNANSSDLVVCLSQILIIKYPGSITCFVSISKA